LTIICDAVVKIIKLAIEAGKANPSPPIGPALGAAGCNIMEFCKAYNAQTQDKIGTVVPVEISVMDVRYSFPTRGSALTALTASLIRDLLQFGVLVAASLSNVPPCTSYRLFCN
jgi:ribosomal protein L11